MNRDSFIQTPVVRACPSKLFYVYTMERIKLSLPALKRASFKVTVAMCPNFLKLTMTSVRKRNLLRAQYYWYVPRYSGRSAYGCTAIGFPHLGLDWWESYIVLYSITHDNHISRPCHYDVRKGAINLKDSNTNDGWFDNIPFSRSFWTRVLHAVPMIYQVCFYNDRISSISSCAVIHCA